jgi:hypothetical protein
MQTPPSLKALVFGGLSDPFPGSLPFDAFKNQSLLSYLNTIADAAPQQGSWRAA